MNNGILRKALLLSCISGAAHFTRAFFTVYGALLVSADVICITEFGFMIAIQFLPGSIIPLAIGFIMHENPRMLHTAVIILNVASLASYLAFIAGLAVSSKNLMIVSIAFLGLTSCSLSPLQRATISSSFKESEAIASGIFLSTANAWKLLGKLLIGPAMIIGDIRFTSLLPILAWLVSIWVVLFNLHPWLTEEIVATSNDLLPLSLKIDNVSSDKDEHPDVSKSADEDESRKWRIKWILLNETTYLLVFLHALFISLYHVAFNFTAYLGTNVWNYSIHKAALFAAIPSFMNLFFTPMVGMIVHWLKHSSSNCLLVFVSSILTTTAYAILGTSFLALEVGLLLAGACQAVVLTVILAMIAAENNVRNSGFAFAMVEAVDALFNFLGNTVFGMLCAAEESCSMGLLSLFLVAVVCCVFSGYMFFRERQSQSFAYSTIRT